ncbi:MAG TPA: endonuclease NucS domain-containing protein [Planctomycetota bacterium]|nr:endonuclease NucS domain-containing protein [Planctomycetota bacterium]
MDAILFSAKPSMVTIDDAIGHLADHKELYWERGGRIARDNFSFPMLGFIHISGGQVEYRVTINDILPFSREHYEGTPLAERVKPEPWRREWRENLNGVRSYPWMTALVIAQIDPFSYDTYRFEKYSGGLVKKPPQNYVRVLPPGESRGTTQPPRSGKGIAETNLEDFVVQQLEAIEPGLRLVGKQLSTPAGRLDLLCRDANNNYVVVELKKAQGTDRVVGQILRYMGWVMEAHPTDNVRGIVVVGRKDPALSYAIKAVGNVEAREFKLVIE